MPLPDLVARQSKERLAAGAAEWIREGLADGVLSRDAVGRVIRGDGRLVPSAEEIAGELERDQGGSESEGGFLALQGREGVRVMEKVGLDELMDFGDGDEDMGCEEGGVGV